MNREKITELQKKAEELNALAQQHIQMHFRLVGRIEEINDQILELQNQDKAEDIS